MNARRTVSTAAVWAVTALLLAATATSAAALTAPVSAGPPAAPKYANLDFDGFFPGTTSIHVGDSVSFAINGFHTVTFLAKGESPPPLILLSKTSVVTGKLDASGSPFWFNKQPQQIINPVVAAPAGGKKYAGAGYLNSGLPSPSASAPPKPFVVKFTKAGTFTFNCLVHPGMKGIVRVLSKSRSVPSPKTDRTVALTQLKNAIKSALQLRKVKPPADTVLAGNDQGPVAWLRFFPKTLTVKAGTTVEFKIASSREVHTFTFGPAAYTSEIESGFTTPQPNPGGPPTLLVNPLGAYPSDPPPLPSYTGANHGNGFEGSGIVSNAGPPLPSSVKLTFTKPGEYGFECVVHQGMDGRIVVTK